MIELPPTTVIGHLNTGRQAHITFIDGECRETRRTGSPAEAAVEAAACLAGVEPWHGDIEAVGDALKRLHLIEDLIVGRLSPTSARLAELLRDKTHSLTFSRRLFGQPPEVISRADAVRHLCRETYDDIRDAVSSLSDVQGTIICIRDDPHAAGIRAHPAWAALNQEFVTTGVRVSVWSAEMSAGIAWLDPSASPVTSVWLDTETAEDWPDTKAAEFVASEQRQRRFLDHSLQALREFRAMEGSGAFGPGVVAKVLSMAARAMCVAD